MDIKGPGRLFPQSDKQSSNEIESAQRSDSPGGISEFESSIQPGIRPADFLESAGKERMVDLAIPVHGALTREREMALAKFEEMLPKLLSMVGIDSSTNSFGFGDKSQQIDAQKQQFAQILQQQLGVDPDQAANLVDGMAKGGTAGMAIAVTICSAIAGVAADGNTSVDLKQLSDLAKQYNDAAANTPSNFFAFTADPAQDSDAAQAIEEMASTSYPDPAVTFSSEQVQTMGMLANSGNSPSTFILSLIESQLTAASK